MALPLTPIIGDGVSGVMLCTASTASTPCSVACDGRGTRGSAPPSSVLAYPAGILGSAPRGTAPARPGTYHAAVVVGRDAAALRVSQHGCAGLDVELRLDRRTDRIGVDDRPRAVDRALGDNHEQAALARALDLRASA